VICISELQLLLLVVNVNSDILLNVSGILYFVSSTVNPILYNVMSLRYRKAFRDTLHAACIAAHCWDHDSPASVALSERHHRPLLHGGNSNNAIGHSVTFNRRARSEDCIRRLSTTQTHCLMARSSAGNSQMAHLTADNMVRGETSQTLQISEQ